MTKTDALGATEEEWLHFDVVLGLTEDLLPVAIDPATPISKNSRMKGRGKTPSWYNANGEVAGVAGWPKRINTAANIEAWRTQPNYGICINTRNVRALDIDIDDPALADEISSTFCDIIGVSPPRRERAGVGRHVLAFHVSGDDLAKRVLKLDGGAVEFLATGQQFVAAGTHLKSGARYTWRGGLPDDFPTIDSAAFEDAWNTLVMLYAVGKVSTGKGNKDTGEDFETEDPVADYMLKGSWDVLDTDGRKLFVTCPWKHLHSVDSGPTETSWLLAGTDGYERGHFKCMHASCAERTRDEFLHEIGYYDAGFDNLPAVQEQPKTQDRSVYVRKDKNGKAIDDSANLQMTLSHRRLCGLTIAYDTFKGAIYLTEADPKAQEPQWRALEDKDYFDIKLRLEAEGFPVLTTQRVREAVQYVAFQNPIDTAQEWLARQTWDGTPRIEQFFIDFAGAADTPYNRAVGRYVWTAAAGRVLKPGEKADMVPVLVGKQGDGKSELVAAMSPSPDFATNVGFHISDADFCRQIRGMLIGEIAELNGLRSRDAEHIKALITRRVDKWTPKYVESTTEYRRRCIMIGTTNDEAFLSDTTGNRRWLPLKVGEVEPAACFKHLKTLRAIRDQLWAEAATIWLQDGQQWQGAYDLGKSEVEQYVMEDIWTDEISAWLEMEAVFGELDGSTVRRVNGMRGDLTSKTILKEALDITGNTLSRAHEMRLSATMRKLGYVKRQRLGAGGKSRYWELA